MNLSLIPGIRLRRARKLRAPRASGVAWLKGEWMRLEKLSHVSPKMGTKTPKYPKVMETNEVSIEGVQKKTAKPIKESQFWHRFGSLTIRLVLSR